MCFAGTTCPTTTTTTTSAPTTSAGPTTTSTVGPTTTTSSGPTTITTRGPTTTTTDGPCFQDADCDPIQGFCDVFCDRDMDVCRGRNCFAGSEVCCADGCRDATENTECPFDPKLCCASLVSQCCVVDGCCNGRCFGGLSGVDFCCPNDATYCDGAPPTCVQEGECCTDCSEEDDPFFCLKGFCDNGTCQQQDTRKNNCCDGVCVTGFECCVDSDCISNPFCPSGACDCSDGFCMPAG